MTAPGGRIAPDGRQPQAPGVGKNAKRHDLEAPATPGLHGSDLQQGDIQALEQGQRIAPRPKKTQAAAVPQRTGTPTPPRKRTGAAEGAPDPIEFAAGKIGGKVPTAGSSTVRVDPSPWMPLVEQIALTPGAGGALYSNYANMLTAFRRNPVVSRSVLLDLSELDDRIERAL